MADGDKYAIIQVMALRLEYPLMSCSSLTKRLLHKSEETVLVHLSDDPLAPSIPGSVRVPLAALRDVDILLQSLGSDPEPDESLFLVCYEAEGLAYSAVAWWLLVSKGWRYVCVLEGGLQAWRRHGDPSLGSQSSEAMSPTRKRNPTILSTDGSLETRTRQHVTTDESSAHKHIYVNTALLLVQGFNLAEPKLLLWILNQAGVSMEEDHETVVFGSKAHLLLLILCSLGKRNITLGVDFAEDFQIATDGDASTEPQRKLSNLTVPTPERSVRSSLLENHLAASTPPTYHNHLTALKSPPQPKRPERYSAVKVCKDCHIL